MNRRRTSIFTTTEDRDPAKTDAKIQSPTRVKTEDRAGTEEEGLIADVVKPAEKFPIDAAANTGMEVRLNAGMHSGTKNSDYHNHRLIN
jgi:hypothetical protein